MFIMETDILNDHVALDNSKESLKLIRNSKGHTWEYKIIGTGLNGVITDEDFKRLKDRDTQLEQEYGQ